MSQAHAPGTAGVAAGQPAGHTRLMRYLDRTQAGTPAGPVARAAVYAGLAFPRGADRPLRRPYIVMNMVRTVDGKTAAGGPGTTDLIGSETDHFLMARIADQTDAVLWGASTIRADDPPYPRLTAASRRRRVAAGLRPEPLWVVVSQSGAFERPPRALRGGPANTVVFLSDRAAPARRDALAKGAQIMTFAGDDLDPRQAVGHLRTRFGVHSLNCLGGPALNAALVAAGVVDELFLTIAPKLQGGREYPSVLTGIIPAGALPHLELLSLYGLGDELFLRYRLTTPDG